MSAAESLEDDFRRMRPVAAPTDQIPDLKALTSLNRRLSSKGEGCSLVGPTGESIPIPESVFYAIQRIAEVLSRGDSITIVPLGKEITTQQAANLLNVSRQYLVRLLNEGRIPYTKTGTHRRLRVEDVVAFKAMRDAERGTALDELTELSESLGGYQELQ